MVRLLTYFRAVNEQIVHKPYPIPKILDMIQNLEGFMYATTVDLNMVYYTIWLTPNVQRICMIGTPWGKYAYLRLPMGIKCAPDIFQSKMNSLMSDLEYVKMYLDDLLVPIGSIFEDRLRKLETLFA